MGVPASPALVKAVERQVRPGEDLLNGVKGNVMPIGDEGEYLEAITGLLVIANSSTLDLVQAESESQKSRRVFRRLRAKYRRGELKDANPLLLEHLRGS